MKIRIRKRLITRFALNVPVKHRALLLVAAIVVMGLASSRMRADTGICGGAAITLPFTAVLSSNGFFCSIASAYFTGLTTGTSATTCSPAAWDALPSTFW